MQQITNDAVTTVNTLYIWLAAIFGLAATALTAVLTWQNIKGNKKKAISVDQKELEAKIEEKVELRQNMQSLTNGMEEVRLGIKDMARNTADLQQRVSALEQKHKSDMEAVGLQFKALVDGCAERHGRPPYSRRRSSSKNPSES